MATANLKNHLTTLSKDELVKHIIELDKKYKTVEEFHHFLLSSDSKSTVKKYKEVIENEFYPKRGEPKMRLSVARNAIGEAKKLGLDALSLADLMLFYVETGVRFTNDYGDIDEAFYNSMESMYLKALKFMHKERMLELYRTRTESILNNTRDIGWGFHDTLGDYFYEFYD